MIPTPIAAPAEAAPVEASASSPGWDAPFPGLRVLKRTVGPVRAVQVFGQRCSGTNVLTKLVAANFGAGAVTDRYGFKHWFVPAQVLFPADVLVLVVAREAQGWARSLHRQPWHAHPDLKTLGFAEFIRAEWHSYWDREFGGICETHPLHGREMLHEREPATGKRFGNPLLKRTAKLRDWTGLAARAHNVAFLDQDVLHRAPRDLVCVLAELLGAVPAGDYGPIETYKGNGFRRFEPTRYPDVSADDGAFIRDQLDPQVEAHFGFR